MRANMSMPNKFSTLEHHMPHIDSFFPHWNAIYYVNDNDGDTFIFNETNDTYDPGQDDIIRIKENKFTVKKRIQAKQGKILIFPGKYYHTSSFARESKFRCVINMNLEKISL
jgi:SOS-response transcriptional repressor LexA